MLSDKYVRVIAGPIGSGKSVCCTHELLRWAMLQEPNHEQLRKTRFLIVRNTADQLKSTTMKTVLDWLPPQIIQKHRVSDKALDLEFALDDGTKVVSEWMFLPLDTPDDVRKALSLEATGLWGNEARELHPTVVDGLLMRVNRYPSMKDGGATRPGAIFDTNMPDEQTWWFDRMEEPPKNWDVAIQPPAVYSLADYVDKFKEDPPEALVGTALDGTQYAVSHEADNFQYLNRGYYPNTMEGKSEDFINVYLRCRYGRSLSGTPVYEKTFNPEFHIAPVGDPIEAVRSEGYPIVIGLDFGRTPAAVFLQMNPRGQVVCLSEVVSQNMGIEKFIESRLRPHIFEHYTNFPLVVGPDPAGFFKQQLGEVSPVDVIKQAGFKVVRPTTNKPELRIQAVERLLLKHVDGKPMFLINPGCSQLIKGFRYGYRYKLRKNGAQEDKPDKNEFSHPHDALQYGCLVVGVSNGSTLGGSQRREVQRVNASGWT